MDGGLAAADDRPTEAAQLMCKPIGKASAPTSRDMCIFNFDAGAAHARQGEGTNHFGLLSDFTPEEDTDGGGAAVTVYDCDPLTWGKYSIPTQLCRVFIHLNSHLTCAPTTGAACSEPAGRL